MSILEKIRPMLQNVANAIGVILDADIVICDDEGNFIAHKDTYIQRKGTEPYLPFNRAVIEGGVSIILENPGKNSLCKGCSNENNCPQKLEIIVPFTYQKKIIGYIGVVTFSEKMRKSMLARKIELMVFLEQMQNLIVRAVKEYDVTCKLNRMMSEQVTVMNSVDSGIISCDLEGVIYNCNSILLNQIKQRREEVIGNKIQNIFPNSFTVNDVLENKRNSAAREYSYSREGFHAKFVVAGGVILGANENPEGAVFVIRDIKEVLAYIHNTHGKTIEYALADIIGVSPAMEELKQKIRVIAPSQSTVLIRGETGTGKELVARAIHVLSPRRNQPFVAINCAAIPDTLLEGELFGYEDGSFTGGKSGGKAGKFEYANGGTVFLDEIGDMPLHLQTKILRTLQEKAVERIGGCTQIKLDIRVISATHQNIEKKIMLSEFREDLYYRLNVIPLSIPPLRKRPEDIKPLTEYFVWKFNKIANKNIEVIDDEFWEALMRYDWPGNIRQLQNTIEYAVAFEETNKLTIKNLSPSVRELISEQEKDNGYNLEARVQATERKIILRALQLQDNDPDAVNKAAQLLGISRSTLYRKARKLGIQLLESG